VADERVEETEQEAARSAVQQDVAGKDEVRDRHQHEGVHRDVELLRERRQRQVDDREREVRAGGAERDEHRRAEREQPGKEDETDRHGA
jgi:hypothetical protein